MKHHFTIVLRLPYCQLYFCERCGRYVWFTNRVATPYSQCDFTDSYCGWLLNRSPLTRLN